MNASDSGCVACEARSMPWDAGYHGTHVAGLVGATANNSAGGTGVAPHSRIMILRVGGGGGRGERAP